MMMKKNLLLVVIVVSSVVICDQAMIFVAAAEPRCGAFKKAVQPCMAYVKGSCDVVSQACCDGIKAHLAHAKKKQQTDSCKCITESKARVQSVADACGL
ncbi:unnamed protein product [Linum trigynum]|uniref:Bifunctional inhibitor/plant lipid transfer protein/seed storage helical domain-containing protein n=1 Tax=Linum trigynum TaxID=586398 RepID=A0AAV2EYP7_9ROSI